MKTQFNCEETFRRMQDYLDRELTAEEVRLVRAHLRGCGVCAEEYVFEASMLKRVRNSLRAVPIPKNLLELVSQSLDHAF